jgi:hypothetical protein
MPPGTEVTFHLDDDGRVRLEPSRDDRAAELRAAVEALRGRAGGRMTTEEIMVLTRG